MLAVVITALAIVNAIFLFVSLPFQRFAVNAKGKKVLTKAGVRALVGLFIFVLLPLIQYFLQEKEATKSENRITENLRTAYQKSVVAIQNNSKKNYDNTIKILSEKLGQYKLGLDSANQRIVDLINDSIPKEAPPTAPVLQIIPTGDEGFKLKGIDSLNYNYKVALTSSDASSCCFNVNSFIVIHNPTAGYLCLDSLPHQILDSERKLSKDGNTTVFFTIPKYYIFDLVFLRLRGTYRDGITKKIYYIDDVYFNNPKSNTFGIMQGETRQKIIKASNKVQ